MGINRSRYYYKPSPKATEEDLEQSIKQIFTRSRNNYGTRKIKHELAQQGKIVSRRKIGQIMARLGLVSNYTKLSYKPHRASCNEQNTGNVLNREFNRQYTLDAIVSDLTYVQVNGKWCYVCLVIDLWNREIIGWSAGKHKNAELVREALYSIPYRLDLVNLFHTDRGREFDNRLIDEVMQAFNINRSLSHKGCPYDNSVNEATNHILKTEFIHQYRFTSLDELKTLLFDYIHWYNHSRIHSSLGYQTPMELRIKSNRHLFYQSALKNVC